MVETLFVGGFPDSAGRACDARNGGYPAALSAGGQRTFRFDGECDGGLRER
jgi:hypothetical protein